LWRRPRPKLGCGAKDRRRKKQYIFGSFVSYFIPTLSLQRRMEKMNVNGELGRI
jgi:hypothetical protein